MRKVKQGDTTRPIVFLMVDSSDHVTGKTGLTPTVTISKNGGAFASPGGTVSEIGNGWYKLTPASGDVDTLGPLVLHAEATGADPVDVEYQVVAYDPYAVTNLGLSNLDTAVSTRSSHTAADVWSVGTRTVTGGSVDSVTNDVNINLSQSLPATPTADTVGAALKDADTQLDAAVSSRATAADVWGYTTRTLTDVVQIDMGQSLPATPTADTVGSALKDADTQLDAAVSTRSSHSASDVWAVATRTITGGTVDSVTNPVQIDMSQALPATPTAGTTGKALFNTEAIGQRHGAVNDTSATTTTFVTDLTETADGHWSSLLLLFVTGANAGVGRRVSGYNGTTKAITLEDPLPVAPSNGDRFVIFGVEVQPEGGGSGTTDWTDAERQQIRFRLGIDGTTATPAASPDLARPSDVWSYASRSLTGPVQIDMSQTLPASPTSDTVGAALKDADVNLDAKVSTRSTFDPATQTVTVGANQDKSGYSLTTTERAAIADTVLSRDVSYVEGSAPEHSLCTIVLAMLETERTDDTWTIYRSDGSSVHVTKSLVSSTAAKPVVKVS